MKGVDLSFAYQHLPLKSCLLTLTPQKSETTENETNKDQQRTMTEISIIINSIIDNKLNIPLGSKANHFYKSSWF